MNRFKDNLNSKFNTSYQDYIINMTNYCSTYDKYINSLTSNVDYDNERGGLDLTPTTAILTNNYIPTNSKINKSNSKYLKPFYKISTETPVSSRPLIYNNNIYFTDWSGNAYCCNKENGQILWKKHLYDAPTIKNCILSQKILDKIPKQYLEKLDVCPPYFWTGLAGTGVIYNDIWIVSSVGGKSGEPFANGSPGKLYALYAKNGDLLWEQPVTTYLLGGVLSPLTAYANTVYCGVSSVDEATYQVAKLIGIPFEPNGKGAVCAFNIETGEKKWEISTIGLLPNDNLAAKGAAVWTSFAIDPVTGIIYFGTGNNYGKPASLSSDALIALNTTDGKIIWQKQVIEGDTWLPGDETTPDDDFGCGPQLFNLIDKNKQSIKAIGIGNKDGFYYCFKQDNGELLWSTKIFTGKDSGSGIRGNSTIKDNRIYVWSNNGFDEEDIGEENEYTITVACLSASNGNIIWSNDKQPTSAITAGVLSNDIFFVGDMLGSIYGYDINNGSIIYKSTIKDMAVAADLAIDNDMLFVGSGIPSLFGGSTKNCGLIVYKIKNER